MSKGDPDHGRCMSCYEMQPDCFCDDEPTVEDTADRKLDELRDGDLDEARDRENLDAVEYERRWGNGGDEARDRHKDEAAERGERPRGTA